MVRVHQGFRVAVLHGPGSELQPVWFDLNGEKHTIKRVTYKWQQIVGAQRVLHYAVVVRKECFVLSYFATTQKWEVKTGNRTLHAEY